MGGKRLALYTFGVLRRPAAEPANDGFFARDGLNLLAVELSEGFIARSGYGGDPGPESWGRQVFPRFYVERGDGGSPSTLSLWADLASPMAFAYAGIHAEALRHGREWFVKPAWPPYALWWVAGDHRPTWEEAVVRHEYLHDHGPSAFAFDFKHAFDEAGMPIEADRAEVRRKASVNRERQDAIGGGEGGFERQGETR
jgi:hypothetical protein